MQRTLCLIFAVLLLLSFCACENALGRNPQFAFVHSAEEDSYFRALAYSFTAAATELILHHPGIFRDYEITKGKMDDVFLAVTGRKLTGGAEK